MRIQSTIPVVVIVALITLGGIYSPICANEILGSMLLTWHNLYFYLGLMKKLEAIKNGEFIGQKHLVNDWSRKNQKRQISRIPNLNFFV